MHMKTKHSMCFYLRHFLTSVIELQSAHVHDIEETCGIEWWCSDTAYAK